MQLNRDLNLEFCMINACPVFIKQTYFWATSTSHAIFQNNLFPHVLNQPTAICATVLDAHALGNQKSLIGP